MRVIAVLSLLTFALQPAIAADYANLPAGPGRDVMTRVCSQCHSPEIAATKNLDQSGWKVLVDQMANNGAQATEAEFDTITKYLAISFPAGVSQPSLNTRAHLSAGAPLAQDKDRLLGGRAPKAAIKATSSAHTAHLTVRKALSMAASRKLSTHR